MKNLFYFIILLLLFLLSSCLKPVDSKFNINVEISFSSQTKTILNKDVNEANGEIILRLDSPLANIGQAHLNIANINDKTNIKTIDLKPINQNTFSGNFEINEAGKYEIIGIFLIGGEEYSSRNKLFINVYDYKKELEPIVNLKNTETGDILKNNIYSPYRNYSLLISVDSEIVYNSDFSYKIFLDNNLVEEGSLKNKTFESTPIFLENKNHIISVEVLDTVNNGFGRTTITLNPMNIDTSFDLIGKIYKNNYNGIILSNNSTLTTIDPIYIEMNINEKYDLPASYLYNISNNDGILASSLLDKKEFKYGPIYLKSGNTVLNLYAKNLISNESTEIQLNLNIEQFEEFTANLEIYKKDYLNKDINIDNSSLITDRDPVYFKVLVNKNYDFSNELNYNFILKKDGVDYKKLNITTNSTILETEKMHLEEGNYELALTITKSDTNYIKEYYKTFKVSKAINNFNLNFSLIQKNSDESTYLYYLPEKIMVDPESTKLNDFDINFNIEANYSYPATYIYSIYINDIELFSSNPVQTRNFKYTSYEFPKGHNYIKISSKDIDSNYLVTKKFEVLVKENNPPELYRVSIEGTDVYSKESTYDFYDLDISYPISNPRIVIDFFDESEIITRDSLNITVKIFENNTNNIINIPLASDQESKHLKFSGILENITLDSTQTWEIKIDPSQIIDEFDNSYADVDDSKKKYYPIHFKTK
ncbi:hypothetical protein JCM30566_16570 [Marinitoga arctica]